MGGAARVLGAAEYRVASSELYRKPAPRTNRIYTLSVTRFFSILYYLNHLQSIL